MKVICMDDNDLEGRKVKLTLNKIYNVDSYSKEYNAWYFTNDDGIPSWYFEDVVIPLEKWRELQLKELGI
jgi:hypothetical protein